MDIQLPEPLALVGMLLFSMLGIWAIKDGRREGNIAVMGLGFVLLFYSYFTDQSWLIWGIGTILSLAVFKLRR